MGIKGTVDAPGKAVVLVEVGVTDMRVVQAVVYFKAFPLLPTAITRSSGRAMVRLSSLEGGSKTGSESNIL